MDHWLTFSFFLKLSSLLPTLFPPPWSSLLPSIRYTWEEIIHSSWSSEQRTRYQLRRHKAFKIESHYKQRETNVKIGLWFMFVTSGQRGHLASASKLSNSDPSSNFTLKFWSEFFLAQIQKSKLSGLVTVIMGLLMCDTTTNVYILHVNYM